LKRAVIVIPEKDEDSYPKRENKTFYFMENGHVNHRNAYHKPSDEVREGLSRVT